jgi:hypothetical protein
MFRFKVTFYRDAAAVDLGGFWWYQKQAGLAGVSSKFWRAQGKRSVQEPCPRVITQSSLVSSAPG